MSILPDAIINQTYIDEIFLYIYTDLVSVHPSNDPFRIFLQYFRPLFDLTLGVAYISNKDTIATSYLSEEILKQIFESISTNSQELWLDCESCKACKNLKNKISYINKIPYIKEAKSCIHIPIKVEGCYQKDDMKHDYCSEKEVGSFLLFSRLNPQNLPGKQYISHQITACFLQQSARRSFLSNNNKHNCLFPTKSCDGKGVGPLNKIGEKLCKRLVLKKT